jgi:integrase
MRPGEVVFMRTRHTDMSGKLWTYRPPRHKTAHYGHKRTVYLGPKACAILKTLLRPSLQDFLFSPAEAETERLAKLHQKRKTPLSCGNVPGSNRRAKPRRQAADHYTVESYRRAIARGWR